MKMMRDKAWSMANDRGLGDEFEERFWVDYDPNQERFESEEEFLAEFGKFVLENF